MYRSKVSISELWAILDSDGKICMSRGGSSSKPKIMVYGDKRTAERALNNSWTRQVIDSEKVRIEKIYSSTSEEESKKIKCSHCDAILDQETCVKSTFCGNKIRYYCNDICKQLGHL